jgi:hypothetical protein
MSKENFLIVNGVKFPSPAPGMSITSSQTVDAGRNLNAAVIGQKVGRRMWKIENLEWHGLDADVWAKMKAAIEPFYIPVTFTGDDNKRHAITMYPGDTSGTPLFLDDIFYKNYEVCKFNLIDCGWDE